ncbi:hypothetical protein [Siccibacter colletis]|uniref:hypothetical protein n=1 Tax=Siccibacter colletis TaxID=1505757 RepID=UPI003CFB7A3A
MVNHVGGHRPHIAHSNTNDIELSNRGSQETQSAARANQAATARQKNINDIAHILTDYFPADIAKEKATALHDELGQKPSDVEAVIKKGYEFDRVTKAFEGAVGALGYAMSDVPGDLIGKGICHQLGLQPGTHVHDMVSGMAGGMTAVGFKAVLEKVFANSVKDTKWLQADMDALEPYMQEVVKKRDNGVHKVAQAAMGGSGFDARNIFTGSVAVGTAALPENDPHAPPSGILESTTKPGYIGNKVVGGVLTAAAGSLSGVVQNKYDRLHGAEFLFGRTDWKERYQALSNTNTISEQIYKGGKSRLAIAGRDAFTTGDNWRAGLANLATPNQIAEKLALGVGLGLTNMAKTGARENVLADALSSTGLDRTSLLSSPAFRARVEAAAQGANLGAAALAYFGQGLAGVSTTELLTMYHRWRDSGAETTGDTTTPSPAAAQDIPLPDGGDSALATPASSVHSAASSAEDASLSSRPASPSSTAETTGSNAEQDFDSTAATAASSPRPSSPAHSASPASVTGSEMNRMFASNATTPAGTPRPASPASVTGSEMNRMFASNGTTPAGTPRPASPASITGSEMNRMFASNATTPAGTPRPASPASVTGSEMNRMFASSATTPAGTPRPASPASVTGSEMNRMFASSATTPAGTPRPASPASSVVSGQDVPLPDSREGSIISDTASISSRASAPPVASRHQMEAQQLAERIGKMTSPSSKSL